MTLSGSPAMFWRPGCLFRTALFRDLDHLDVPYLRQNIWEDAEAAATVRRAADGNETVPTVLVGQEALVNPSVQSVLATVHRLDPTSELPRPSEAAQDTSWLFRLLGRSSPS